MSKLTNRKRHARYETESVVFSRGTRPVLVELFPDRIEVRLKGMRTRYAMSYDQIFDSAMKRGLAAAAVARKLARKAAKFGVQP